MQNPNQPPWLQLLPSLFAIGARIGGAPQVGTAALQGAQQGNLLLEEQRQRQAAESQRQQQIDMQQMAFEQQQAVREAQAEERRQSAIKSAVDDLRLQKFAKKGDYDQAVTFRENLLMQTYGVRPNTLRTLVPYNGPTAESRAKEALETISKRDDWHQIVTGNGLVQFDRDEDGVPENVPVMDLVKLGNFPLVMDPQTGKPMVPPKGVKPENVEEFDVTYRGVLSEWQAEGKDVANPAVQGKAAVEARNRIARASRQAVASIVMPPPQERPFTRFQRVQVERQIRGDAEKVLQPIRDMNRQVSVMRAGMDQINRTGRLDAGTQAVINTFNRIMEPGSVTREAEYMRTTLGQPLFESLSGQWQRLFQGGAGVTKESLQLAVDLAEQIVEQMSGAADTQLEDLRLQAADFELPVDRIVPKAESYRLKPRGGRTQPQAGANGVPPVGSIVTVRGQKVRVTGYNPDGSVIGVVVR